MNWLSGFRPPHLSLHQRICYHIESRHRYSIAHRKVASLLIRSAPTPKTVAITQSNYIPWKGYFDLVRSVDELVLFDSMQFTRRDWRNRNRIKTAHGPAWLTIPVQVKGKYHQKISETVVANHSWAATHWRTIANAYAKAPFFSQFAPFFENLYAQAAQLENLSAINHLFLSNINHLLNIKTPLIFDTAFPEFQGKTERLVALCQAARATTYISGPAAKDYIDESLFEQADIRLSWFDYPDYPQYPQLHPPFDHHVSIIDLIFHVGTDIKTYLQPAEPTCLPTPS